MDLKQVEYILKIAEENNITHAAEKLFITQSALNQQLLKLEKELGTPLFYRSRTNWRPTPAGEIYIRAAKQMLHMKKITYDRIHDIAETKKGSLTIGLTPGRGIEMFTAVYPQFHQEYSEMTVTPVERVVIELQDMLADDQLDIAFLTLSEKERTADNYITLQEEEILLVIPSGHPLSQYAAPIGEPYAVIDLKELRYEPFVIMQKFSTLRHLIDDIFKESGFKPHVMFETQSNATIISLIRSCLCCGLLPRHYVKDNPPGIACFALPSHPHWQVTACYKKDSYLTKASQYFIELARRYWNS